ncbi:MAG: NAD-dependent DNA ligase LigA [Spirochaetota bacterium]|nr:MAG: NAD-dependent DNA ligase LigA [Spirochaetota bacterium]
MTEDIKKRIFFLVKEIRRHQDLYYKKTQPEISDSEYDALFDELLELEKKYPELASSDSPTRRVGSDLDNEFPEVPHEVPMLSLDKVYRDDQLMEWIDKVGKGLFNDLSFVIEEKVDGSTIVLHYEDGILKRAVTRGNGLVGNDITENVRTIRDIPLRLAEPVTSVFRGEIYLNLSDFEALNKEVDNIYANPRNFAAGSLRRKKSSEVSKIPLRSFVYEGFFGDETMIEHLVVLHRLSQLGFHVGNDIGFFSSSTDNRYESIFQAHSEWVKGSFNDIGDYIHKKLSEREKLDYEIDGLVVKVGEYAERDRLGYTSHHPRWAMAYKFEAPQAISDILNIEVQVGRTGRITPVARIKPVRISGTTVSNVTLHNQDYITSLDVAVGDKVAVSRRGDVIPAVEEVLEKNSLGNKAFLLPDICPVCKSTLVQEGAHHFCTNRDCPARIYGRLSFFVARGQMDIENLGGETIRQLIDLGYVKDIPDIYYFNPDNLLGHEGFAEKKVALIKEGIEQSKKRPYSSVLSSLGFDEIGPRVVEILIDEGYTSIDMLLEAASKKDSEVFTRIQGIGPKIARRIIDQLNDRDNRELIHRLKEAGLNFSEEVSKKEIELAQTFSGEIWCVTGTFEHFKPRERAMDEVKRCGGRVTSSVTSKTTHLLVGKNPGSKEAKARQFGTNIVYEEEFLKRLEE